MKNGEPVLLRDVPLVSNDEFALAIRKGLAETDDGAPERDAHLSALFGDPADEPEKIRLYALLGRKRGGTIEVLSTEVRGHYTALTPFVASAHWFEREIAEQWRVEPRGHPWMKPIRFHAPYRRGDRSGLATDPTSRSGDAVYFRVEGDEIHEVAVGPVHAGIIEPGHFRFQCHGERVLHLEISLGYQHRGIERAMAGGPSKRSLHYMETLAGDTTVGHAVAYARVIEGLSGTKVTADVETIRAVALELERCANHTGDLGALANDVGFLPTAAYCGRLRGDFLNATLLACGNRFGRGWIRPGGLGFGLDRETGRLLTERIRAAIADTGIAADLLFTTPSVLARFEGVGSIDGSLADTLGLVGPAARASGIRRDVRVDFPIDASPSARIPISTWGTGDVYARAFVRWLELRASASFIEETIDGLASHVGPTPRIPDGALAKSALVASLVEGWRGEICHVALTDDAGRLSRYKIVDPSFHNWIGLAMALRDQEISDFPLCNKSFNLSYSGHDL